ncbi:MAG: recombinase family protein [Eubacteriales bacterium]|nr:recombinase family protein [Eubacteriales bacterium]
MAGPEAPRRAALYMRLSKDDEGVGESASIATQREILRRFAAREEIPIAEEFVDDGYSGTSFERPAFRRMLAAIEAEEIDCVLVKDLSRLGRNSARTTELLEEVFPRHRVRFLSVSDGFDSRALSNGMALAAPFMLVLHEAYARDISQKIRSSLRAKMERGDFIGPFAPYGYRKDPENRNHLLPDEEAAEIVRSIFRMAADGCRPSDIARTLNARQIPTPAAYRRLHSAKAGPEPDGRREWTSSMLCKLLRNPVYRGQTTQGKTTKLSFKSRETLSNRREDWITVEGTHTPLVSDALFEQVRRRTAARRCSPGRGFRNLFSGLAFCADCGRAMTIAPSRKKSRIYDLCCGTYKARGAGACSNHFIGYDTLCRIVQAELRTLLPMTGAERAQLFAMYRRDALARAAAERGTRERRLREEEARLRELELLIRRAFELSALGGASTASCAQLLAGFETERAGLERSVRWLRKALAPDSPAEDEGAFLARLDDLLRVDELSADLLHRLIDRIEVEQGHYETGPDGKRTKRQTIRIVYRFDRGR